MPIYGEAKFVGRRARKLRDAGETAVGAERAGQALTLGENA
jgi:hypothetical protein